MPWVSQLMFLLAIDEDSCSTEIIRQVRRLLNEAIQLFTNEDRKEYLN